MACYQQASPVCLFTCALHFSRFLKCFVFCHPAANNLLFVLFIYSYRYLSISICKREQWSCCLWHEEPLLQWENFVKCTSVWCTCIYWTTSAVMHLYISIMWKIVCTVVVVNSDLADGAWSILYVWKTRFDDVRLLA